MSARSTFPVLLPLGLRVLRLGPMLRSGLVFSVLKLQMFMNLSDVITCYNQRTRRRSIRTSVMYLGPERP